MLAASSSQNLRLLSSDFFARKVEDVAPSLIGCALFTTIDGMRTGGIIIETEAYDQDDPACHCHPLASPRRRKHSTPMRLIGGHAYVHRDRGMWCLNITCDSEGFGSAVLIRAIKPDGDIGAMSLRRSNHNSADKRIKERVKGYERALCSGPSKLCEALGITDAQNEQSVFDQPFELHARSSSVGVLNGPRINVSEGRTIAWRWGLAGAESYLSKKFG